MNNNKMNHLKPERCLYDVGLIFGDPSVDKLGGNYAETLGTLLMRFAHIKVGCFLRRKPEIYAPKSGFLTNKMEKEEATVALNNAEFIFIIVTQEMCANSTCIDTIQEQFHDVLARKKAERRLVPIYVSYRFDARIPAEMVPFGLENVVGINISDLAGDTPLLDIDAEAVKAKYLDSMCVQKFIALLNYSFRIQKDRTNSPIGQEALKRRQILYKFAQEKLAEIRARDLEQRKTNRQQHIHLPD